MPTGSRSWKKDKILFECSATPLGAETFCALASDGSPAAMFFEAKGKGKKGYRILRKGKQKHAKGKSKGNSLILAKGKGFKTRSTEGHGSFSRRSPRSTQILVLGASCHTTGVASGIHPQHMLIVGRVDIWHRDCPKQKAD